MDIPVPLRTRQYDRIRDLIAIYACLVIFLVYALPTNLGADLMLLLPLAIITAAKFPTSMPFPAISYAVAAYWVAITASLCYSVNRMATVEKVAVLTFSSILYFYTLIHAPERWISITLMVSSLWISTRTLLSQVLSLHYVVGLRLVPIIEFRRQLFGDPDGMRPGNFAPVLILGCYFALRAISSSRTTRLLALLTVILSTIALLLLFSRGATLALLVFGISYTIGVGLTIKAKRMIRREAILAAASVLCVAVVSTGLLASVRNDYTERQSATGRFYIMRESAAIQIRGARLIGGYGAGSFPIAVRETHIAHNIQQPFNVFENGFIELGTLGILALSFLWISLLFTSYDDFAVSPSKFACVLALLCLACTQSYLLANIPATIGVVMLSADCARPGYDEK